MPSVKEMDEAIDASINTMTANFPVYIDYFKSCAKNDRKLFADRMKATVRSMILKSWEDDYFSLDPMIIQSNKSEELSTILISRN